VGGHDDRTLVIWAKALKLARAQSCSVQAWEARRDLIRHKPRVQCAATGGVNQADFINCFEALLKCLLTFAQAAAKIDGDLLRSLFTLYIRRSNELNLRDSTSDPYLYVMRGGVRGDPYASGRR